MEKAYESMFGIKHAGPGCTESVRPPCSLNTSLYRARFRICIHLVYSIWNHVCKAIYNFKGIAHLKFFRWHLKSTAVRKCAVYSRAGPENSIRSVGWHPMRFEYLFIFLHLARWHPPKQFSTCPPGWTSAPAKDRCLTHAVFKWLI